MLPPRLRAALPTVLTILLTATLVMGAWKVLLWAFFEYRGMPTDDAGIFLTVGRGMLMGLRPYLDLFETKTPAVFSLYALSLKLTGGMHLMFWLQAVVILLIPVCIVRTAASVRRDVTSLLLAGIVAAVITLYAGMQGGQLFMESFGTLFTLHFLFVYRKNQEKEWSKPTWLLLAILLLLACAMKEPFLLSVWSAVLLLSRDWWRDMRRMAIVSVLAGVLWILVLLPFPIFRGYFSVYLPHMLGFHVSHPWGTIGEPTLLRFNDLPRFWTNLSTLPFLSWMILTLWFGGIVALLSSASSGAERAVQAGRWLAASFLTTAAVGLVGDFYGHHFLYAVPLYVALFLVILRDGPSLTAGWKRTGFGLVALTASLVVWLAPVSISSLQNSHQSTLDHAATFQPMADLLDGILDRCGEEHYLHLIDRDSVFGYMKHLPYGPLFNQLHRELVSQNPFFVQSIFGQMNSAHIIMTSENDDLLWLLAPEQKNRLFASLSTTPPPCAGSVTVPAPYHLWFRGLEGKEAGGVKL